MIHDCLLALNGQAEGPEIQTMANFETVEV